MNMSSPSQSVSVIWTGIDISTQYTVIFNFTELPAEQVEIEFLDKIDNRIHKAKVEKVTRTDTSIELEVTDHTAHGHRFFEVFCQKRKVVSEDTPSPAEHPAPKGLGGWLIFFSDRIGHLVYRGSDRNRRKI